MITIATNMAGRGTDIVLGGNVEKQMQFVQADAAIEDADEVSSESTSCAMSGNRCTTRSSARAG